MNINEVKDLMREFDGSSLREFSWNNAEGELAFSKNNGQVQTAPTSNQVVTAEASIVEAPKAATANQTENQVAAEPVAQTVTTEGEAVTSPLVGVVYLKPAPEKAPFVTVGATVKKGQTLLIIEAMKVMNEIIAPKDGVITEILVAAEEVVEFGQELVKIN